MNYRHAFHAGNFADVFKHAVLVRILLHLRSKATPFRVIDTHAGAGRYDLRGPEATRGSEWRAGIGRLNGAPLSQEERALLAPYVDAVVPLRGGRELLSYPGSPALTQALLRSQDRLIACELEPNAAAALNRSLARDQRCKAIAIDGWTALNAYVPPKERRGLVLIDPAFEETDDFRRLVEALIAAHRKWASGIYLAWYPIKQCEPAETLARRLRQSGIPKILRADLSVATPREEGPLRACGLVIVNPPWTLERELEILLPALARVLSQDGCGSHHLDWLGDAR